MPKLGTVGRKPQRISVRDATPFEAAVDELLAYVGEAADWRALRKEAEQGIEEELRDKLDKAREAAADLLQEIMRLLTAKEGTAAHRLEAARIELQFLLDGLAEKDEAKRERCWQADAQTVSCLAQPLPWADLEQLEKAAAAVELQIKLANCGPVMRR